jgi:uroporphyrinogen decarboxylase
MLLEKKILGALQGKAYASPPFWLMRQAGRYLPEYRALRAEAGSFLKLCYTPHMAAEVTLQPLRRFGMDAAILFSDILVVPQAMGQPLDFVEGEGPRLGALDMQELDTDVAGILSPVYDTVSCVRAELPADKTLIGFAGAPWTVACYMIEGRGGTGFPSALDMLRNDRATFDALMDMLVIATSNHLSAQIKAGADCVQLFDSWAGMLQGDEFDACIITPARKIVAALKEKHPQTPVIGFPRGAAGRHADYALHTGIDGMGVENGTSLSGINTPICLQGNLAPETLLAGGDRLRDETLQILQSMKGRPFIFNLGHGVIKETPPGNVAALAKIIKDFA